MSLFAFDWFYLSLRVLHWKDSAEGRRGNLEGGGYYSPPTRIASPSACVYPVHRYRGRMVSSFWEGTPLSKTG